MKDALAHRGVEYTIERGISVDTSKGCWIAKFISPKDSRLIVREYRTRKVAMTCAPYAIDLEFDLHKITINPPEL